MAAAREPDDERDEEDAKPFWRRRNVQVAGLCGLLAVAFLFTRGKEPHRQEDKKDAAQYIGVVVPYQPVKADPAPDPAPVKPVETPRPPVTVTAPVPPPAPPAPPGPPPAPAFHGTMPLPPGVAPKPSRPVMLSYAVKIDPPKPAPASPADPPQTGLEFKVSAIPGLKAGPALDTALILLPGLLPAVLDSAIQSDQPGALLAHLPGPAYSPKGVVLLEAGTQIIGRYDPVRNGQTRLNASSVYAITPSGVPVPLTGQSFTDDVGRNGLQGEVDAHFGQRFGASVLLTLTQSALSIIEAKVSQGGNTYLSLGNGGGGSGLGGLAQQILQSQINIAPTIRKNQGELVAVLLDEPIDFSASYKIRPVRAP